MTSITQSYPRVLVQGITTRTHGFTFQDPNQVFASATVVFVLSGFEHFSVLQSTLHDAWAWKYSSTMKGDRSYRPSDCFDTFPFPTMSSTTIESLQEVGETYYQIRLQLLNTFSLSPTQLYNLFHTPNSKWDSEKFSKEILLGIESLRIAKRSLDSAVLSAYGFSCDQRFNFWEHPYILQEPRTRYSMHPDEIKKTMNALLKLNHERFHQEQTTEEFACDSV